MGWLGKSVSLGKWPSARPWWTRRSRLCGAWAVSGAQRPGLGRAWPSLVADRRSCASPIRKPGRGRSHPQDRLAIRGKGSGLHCKPLSMVAGWRMRWRRGTRSNWGNRLRGSCSSWGQRRWEAVRWKEVGRTEMHPGGRPGGLGCGRECFGYVELPWNARYVLLFDDWKHLCETTLQKKGEQSHRQSFSN